MSENGLYSRFLQRKKLETVEISSFKSGGDGGSRTRVQEYFRKTFSERSRLLLFRSPVALRQTRGSLSRGYSYATGRSRKRSLHA